jgi:hypothetical protein
VPPFASTTQVGLIQVLGAMANLSMVTTALLACLTASCAPAGYQKAAAFCADIRPGMTEEKVISIMGPPKSRDEPPARPGQIWLRYYEGGDLAPIIVILTKSGANYVVAQDGSCGA